MINKLKVLIQYITPQRSLTQCAGYFAKCRWVWLKNCLIKAFIRHFRVDLSEAQIEDPETYPDFNSFFTRHLKANARPIARGPNQIACPADGCISQIGRINQQTLLQTKGVYFDLTTLLGGSPTRAALFSDGLFATIYLSPKDYHRVHMPLDGKLRETVFIPGKLFSVNQNTTERVPSLFARNERLVSIFETQVGPMAMIMVGAMIVGSINTVWDAIATPKLTVNLHENVFLQKGAEMGYFELGSTVMMLFGKDKIHWLECFEENQSVRMGQEMGFMLVNEKG